MDYSVALIRAIKHESRREIVDDILQYIKELNETNATMDISDDIKYAYKLGYAHALYDVYTMVKNMKW